jgi:hypothetical protein
MPIASHWTCVRQPCGKHGSGGRYVRSDGAVVQYDDRSPYPNPVCDSARMWTAWEPDPGERYLSMGRRSSQFNWPRRYHTAEAAMRAADRAWPLVVSGAKVDAAETETA